MRAVDNEHHECKRRDDAGSTGPLNERAERGERQTGPITGTSVQVSNATVRIEKPVVRFSGGSSDLQQALTAGKAAPVPFRLTNQGNVDTGKATVTLELSVAPVGEPNNVVFLSELIGQRLSVKAGLSKVLKPKVAFSLSPGAYVLTIRLAAEGTLLPLLESNNAVVATIQFAI